MIGVRAQIQAPPPQLSVGISRPGISPSIVSQTNVVGYHAPGTNSQATTQQPRSSIMNGAQGMISRIKSIIFLEFI